MFAVSLTNPFAGPCPSGCGHAPEHHDEHGCRIKGLPPGPTLTESGQPEAPRRCPCTWKREVRRDDPALDTIERVRAGGRPDYATRLGRRLCRLCGKTRMTFEGALLSGASLPVCSDHMTEANHQANAAGLPSPREPRRDDPRLDDALAPTPMPQRARREG